MTGSKILITVGLVLVSLVTLTVSAVAEGDLFEEAPWSVSLELGRITYEHDEEVEDGNFWALRLGYDLNPRWTWEADFNWMPRLENREFDDPRRSPLTDDTWAIRLGLDVLFHLRNIENLRWDPYLSLGAGFIHYGDELVSGSTEGLLIGGAGMFYHFSDEWAVRADLRGVVAGDDTEGNLLMSAGVNWRWGGGVPVQYSVSGGDIDSDNDGLLDSEESEIGTDPYNPDTDGDGLSDGVEHNGSGPLASIGATDPLNPDTDWDALKDGAEVLTYSTNPLERDTDNGGVADGHEVIEDHTDPLDPSDDLQLFTLNIEFDVDKSFIRPRYYDQLDVVVKVLQRDSGATAKVEGHADQRKTSKRDYNIKLSERRAKAVMEYLVNVGGIEASRLSYAGFGFDVPVAPNDTEDNMQKNRRTEIYIRPGDDASPAMNVAEPQIMPEEEIPLDEMPDEMPIK